ncbi:MAG TPA: gephyrin-like molybdotransferase Glp [Terracidiphilus sp.]|nr:gephyrin-like molybdotransferase Glp [Terracidiphilus sp.]
MIASLPGYTEAAALIADRAAHFAQRSPRSELVALSSALARVLARPICADRDMPAFPRSTRDGFACRAEEASSHGFLAIAGSIRAGDPPAGPLPHGAAWEIMTGAAVPAGADAVVMLEHVEHGLDRIRLAAGRSIESGDNIVPTGAEARAGDELIAAGARMSPAHIAAAAACGYANLRLFARPRVAILTTGDELVSVDSTPGPGQVRNSNAAMLAALVTQAGGEPWILPTTRDEAQQLDSALRQALDADLLLISGGVSAGKFDLVEPALARLAAHFHFTGVRIQPGKPLVYCEVERQDAPVQPVFGLPGNPISSAATFLLFASAILAALAGNREKPPGFDAAVLARDVKGKSDLTRFVPAATSFADGRMQVTPVGSQGSGDLAAFARADCFLMVPEGVERLPAGSAARILRF